MIYNDKNNNKNIIFKKKLYKNIHPISESIGGLPERDKGQIKEKANHYCV